MTIKELRNQLEQQRGRRQQIENDIETTTDRVAEQKKSLHRHEEAREVVRAVGLSTQQQLQFHISDITSLALNAVFNDPYQLVAEFTQRRNKTECDLLFERDGNRIDPLSASGGGAVDVAALALRVASWSMRQPKVCNTLILDEPFRHLKGVEANMRVLEMMRKLHETLKLQIIMVSDERIPREDIIDRADRIFETRIRKGITRVSVIK